MPTEKSGENGADAPEADVMRCKVGQVIQEHGLEGIGEQLEARWTAESGDRASLRELAGHFNQQVLESRLREAGEQPLAGEIENLYRLLTSDDISSGERTHARRRLQRQGIDVDGLADEFVSHQAVHTYLTKYRGAEPGSASEDKVQKDAETIQRAKSRIVAVTERVIENLRETGRVSIGTVRVFVEVRVVCEDCGSSYTAGEFLSTGSCDCDAATSN